jgi:hypothetical protein
MVPDIVPVPSVFPRRQRSSGREDQHGVADICETLQVEMESHHHDTDEYLFFLGATFPDLVGSFDAEIEYFIGKEYERKPSPRQRFSIYLRGWNIIPATSRGSASRCSSVRFNWRPTSTASIRRWAIANSEAA